ncbi:MAG: chromosomal replication initiator protein DnaA [Solirubrobacterales bacterium]
MELEQLWLKTCAVFREDVCEDVYDLWLAQLKPLGVTDRELYLTGPPRARGWIDLRYRRALGQCASKAAGVDLVVMLIDPADIPLERFATTPLGGSAQRAATADRANFTPLNPRYTFDQFVIGRSNHVGHAAALAVAEQPAQAFNPLFLYGSPGVGKTHLLQAIGNFMRRESPELAVRYMTAEDFASAFRSVVRDGSIGDFKDDLRASDVLLIDDVQFLQNKIKTEEEFFHTFNALYESGRQLVISSDRTPRQLDALADRLRARFESGLVVEIEQPDQALRIAILAKRAQLDNIAVQTPAALERIADRAPANVRSLEGALIRVSAFASMRRTEITPELVDELLDTLHPHDRRRVSIAQIQSAVSEHFGLTLDELCGEGRDRRVSRPRQLAMYLACELTGENLPMIATAFGRDHSTVVYARDKVVRACREDADTASTADRLRHVINGEVPGRPAA